MDGERIQEYWSSEIDALIRTYTQFEKLIPSEDARGAAHPAEDGRFVEDLLREYLRRYLPKGLEVLTGFILRPAVKTGKVGRERNREGDNHSTQLDILVFDSATYPAFQRFGDSVVVPPEGVIAIVSVKKHLRDNDVSNECEALAKAAELCEVPAATSAEQRIRGPFLALVSVHSEIEKTRTDTLEWIFAKMSSSYSASLNSTFDRLVGFVGSLSQWSIFKRRPNGAAPTEAEYVGFYHQDGESHLGLQFLLTGILSVFYDRSRRDVRRPGFTAFPSGRPHDKLLGRVPCQGLR